MPNVSFVIVSFAIHLALSLWIGGTVFLGALAAPIVFRGAPSRAMAGALVGRMVDGFARVKLACMGVLVVAAWWRFSRWEVWGAWIEWRAALIVSAVVLESAASWGIGPRILAARAAIEEAGLDFDRDTDHPLRIRFRRLHGMVMGLQTLAALAAAGALLMFF